MNIREKILSIFKRKDKSVREISKEISLPKSTVHYNLTQTKVRQQKSGSEFWDTEEGYRWSIKVVVSTIYFFGVKGGFGAGKLKDFFEILNLSTHMGISETTILKIIKQIENLLIEYGDAKSKEIKSKVKEIELILGVDETWFDSMLLVCQELQSGFIFCEEPAKDRSAETWDNMIKKILSVSE
jgi:hypothetical protein